MQPLTEDFLDQCPVENGFRMRGVAMTRIEVFVDAAFAFAVTMLVISIDEIPSNMTELIAASKYIPAFILSVAQVVYIWHHHSTWSRKFGLEDSQTVILSVSLLTAVLVYIYPLKILFEGLFTWLSQGYLPSGFQFQSYDELRFLFYYLAIGFLIICLIFMALYRHALKLKLNLKLSEFEIFNVRTSVIIRFSMIIVATIALITPALLPSHLVPFSGFVYILLWPSVSLVHKARNRKWQKLKTTD